MVGLEFTWEADYELLLFANWTCGKFRVMIRPGRIHLPSNNYESQQGTEEHVLPKIANRPWAGTELPLGVNKSNLKRKNNRPQIMLKRPRKDHSYSNRDEFSERNSNTNWLSCKVICYLKTCSKQNSIKQSTAAV